MKLDVTLDEEANRKFYGNTTSAAKIITESDASAPSAAHDLIAALQKSSLQSNRHTGRIGALLAAKPGTVRCSTAVKAA